MPNKDEWKVYIGKLELCKDDILVVHYPEGQLTQDHIKKITETFRDLVPGVRVLIMPNYLQLFVISKEEADTLEPRKPPERIIPADLP